MATIQNERDKLLQAAAVRLTESAIAVGATVGAPAGTLVGSILAQNVESTSGAQAKATAAQTAAQAYAAAQATAADVSAKAYADGIVTAEETRAIADATAKAEAARVAAVAAAAADATTKANAAQTAAQTYAAAQAVLAETQAKAYADGIVAAEETRAIADATAKAEAARVAAVAAAAADATTKANAAQTAAQTYAAAQATLAETQAKAYADGVVDAEETRAIADATAKAEAARVAAVAAAAADATSKDNAISVGGRNILRKAQIGGTPATDPYGASNAVSFTGHLRIAQWTRHEVGYYSLSFWAKSVEAQTKSIDLCDQSIGTAAITTSWQYFKFENCYCDSVYLNYVYNGFLDFEGGTSAAYTLYNLKLEVGSKATDWSPAPEDVDAAALAYAQAQATLAETQAKAYADGIVTAAEADAIAAAAADATTKANAAALTATWSGVSGTGKPQDNATVGATAGTNLLDSNGALVNDDAIKNNLIDLGFWKRNGPLTWSLNAEANGLLHAMADVGLSSGPKGADDVVWYCEETTGDGNQGGGWNSPANIQLNPARTYRFVIPLRVINPSYGGSFYWGTQNVCNLNTTTWNGNPYFVAQGRGSLSSDRWYLLVGYIYPHGSTGNSHDSAGVWDCKTGLKVLTGTNWCHMANGSVGHRAYQYYANLNASQAFGRPMINLVDGTEPSLREYFEPDAVLNTVAIAAAATDATTKANAAQAAAQAYAAAQATLAETTAKAYADGIVTAAEADAIAAAAADATTKANAAALTATWAGVSGTGKPSDNANQTYVDANGNIQGVSSGGGVSVANNVDTSIRLPGGGFLSINAAGQVGAIKVKLPVLGSNTMIKFDVDIYEYSAGYSCKVEIAGYNYGGGGPTDWINVTARVLGGSNTEYPVYFGRDADKDCIWIGTPSTTWEYPQVRVKDVHLGYGNFGAAQWATGWVVSLDTTAITSGYGANQYSNSVADTLPGADWSKISGATRPDDRATVGPLFSAFN